MELCVVLDGIIAKFWNIFHHHFRTQVSEYYSPPVSPPSSLHLWMCISCQASNCLYFASPSQAGSLCVNVSGISRGKVFFSSFLSLLSILVFWFPGCKRRWKNRSLLFSHPVCLSVYVMATVMMMIMTTIMVLLLFSCCCKNLAGLNWQGKCEMSKKRRRPSLPKNSSVRLNGGNLCPVDKRLWIVYYGIFFSEILFTSWH